MMAYPPTNYETVNSFTEQDRDESIDSFKTDDRSSKGKIDKKNIKLFR